MAIRQIKSAQTQDTLKDLHDDLLPSWRKTRIAAMSPNHLKLNCSVNAQTVLLLAVILCCSLRSGSQVCPNDLAAKSKRAMGGAAMDEIRSTYIKGNVTTGSLTGEEESFQDNRTGAYVEKYQLGPTRGAEGFDGQQVWSQDTSGQPRAEGSDDSLEGAADRAYRTAMAYWYPDRWQAKIECLGTRMQEGKAFYVLRISPKRGRPFELWVNAKTYLLDHIVEGAATETVSTYYSDYRDVNGARLPFTIVTTNGNRQYDRRTSITTIEFNRPLQPALFRMPAAPPPDYTITDGQSSTTVPFEFLGNHIYVSTRINGKGPFRIVCDTGAANIITPTLAHELGLKPEGTLQGQGTGEKSVDIGLVTIRDLQIGGATLSDQVFMVFPIENFSASSGARFDGLIGYEVFKRFVTKVDYERLLLTFTLPPGFEYNGKGTVVPFVFDEHIPQVDGTVDGIPGKFNIDTGSGGSLDLLGPFVAKHDLVRRYHPTVEAVTGWGVGGAERSLVTRAKLLTLGGVQVRNPVTELTRQKTGAYSNRYLAGNVGTGVLKRFNLTFDYPRQRIIFEPNSNYDKPDLFDRSGMSLNVSGNTFQVMHVVHGGPAERAGLRAGDQIISVDGQTASELPLPVLRMRLKNDPPGTRLRLIIRRDAVQREAELILRNLV